MSPLTTADLNEVAGAIAPLPSFSEVCKSCHLPKYSAPTIIGTTLIGIGALALVAILGIEHAPESGRLIASIKQCSSILFGPSAFLALVGASVLAIQLCIVMTLGPTTTAIRNEFVRLAIQQRIFPANMDKSQFGIRVTRAGRMAYRIRFYLDAPGSSIDSLRNEMRSIAAGFRCEDTYEFHSTGAVHRYPLKSFPYELDLVLASPESAYRKSGEYHDE